MAARYHNPLELDLPGSRLLLHLEAQSLFGVIGPIQVLGNGPIPLLAKLDVLGGPGIEVLEGERRIEALTEFAREVVKPALEQVDVKVASNAELLRRLSRIPDAVLPELLARARVELARHVLALDPGYGGAAP